MEPSLISFSISCLGTLHSSSFSSISEDKLGAVIYISGRDLEGEGWSVAKTERIARKQVFVYVSRFVTYSSLLRYPWGGTRGYWTIGYTSSSGGEAEGLMSRKDKKRKKKRLGNMESRRRN